MPSSYRKGEEFSGEGLDLGQDSFHSSFDDGAVYDPKDTLYQKPSEFPQVRDSENEFFSEKIAFKASWAVPNDNQSFPENSCEEEKRTSEQKVLNLRAVVGYVLQEPVQTNVTGVSLSDGFGYSKKHKHKAAANVLGTVVRLFPENNQKLPFLQVFPALKNHPFSPALYIYRRPPGSFVKSFSKYLRLKKRKNFLRNSVSLINFATMRAVSSQSIGLDFSAFFRSIFMTSAIEKEDDLEFVLPNNCAALKKSFTESSLNKARRLSDSPVRPRKTTARFHQVLKSFSHLLLLGAGFCIARFIFLVVRLSIF